MDIIKSIEQEQLKDNVPEFRVGDTVVVNYRIIEGSRERVQAFEGTVIKRQGGGINETFTVRRLSYGVGVEELSLYILRESRKSKLRNAVKYVAQNFTIYVLVKARQQRLKKRSFNVNRHCERDAYSLYIELGK